MKPHLAALGHLRPLEPPVGRVTRGRANLGENTWSATRR